MRLLTTIRSKMGQALHYLQVKLQDRAYEQAKKQALKEDERLLDA